MASANVIDVVVIASTTQAEAGLKKVGKVAESELGAGGSLGKASKEAESGLSKAGKGAGNFLTSLTGLSPEMLGAAAIGGSLALVADGVFKAFEENQKATINLEVEMKNASEKVTPQFTKALQDAQHAGENLGFSQANTTTTMGALTLAGLTTAQAFKQLPVIMDLARAKNIDMTTATELFVKGIAGAGRGLKDMNIIGLMVLPTTAAIAAAHVKLAAAIAKYGANSAQARAEQEKLNTTLNIAAVRAHNLTIMHDELSKKVGGAASAATHTLGVEWQIVTAKFNDFAGQAIPFVENALAALLSAVAAGISWIMTNVMPTVSAVFNNVIAVIKTLMPEIKIAFAVIATVIKISLTIIVTTFRVAFAVIGTIIRTIVTVVQAVAGPIAAVFRGIASVVGAIFGGMATVIRGAFSVIGGLVSAVIAGPKAIIDGIISAINLVIGVIDALPSINVGPVHLSFPKLPKIPTLDTGGIVSKPTLAWLAMNSKPEAVIPLSGIGGSGPKGAGSGGGDTYNINTNVASPADPNSISRAVVFGLRSRSRASLAIA